MGTPNRTRAIVTGALVGIILCVAGLLYSRGGHGGHIRQKRYASWPPPSKSHVPSYSGNPISLTDGVNRQPQPRAQQYAVPNPQPVVSNTNPATNTIPRMPRAYQDGDQRPNDVITGNQQAAEKYPGWVYDVIDSDSRPYEHGNKEVRPASGASQREDVLYNKGGEQRLFVVDSFAGKSVMTKVKAVSNEVIKHPQPNLRPSWEKDGKEPIGLIEPPVEAPPVILGAISGKELGMGPGVGGGRAIGQPRHRPRPATNSLEEDGPIRRRPIGRGRSSVAKRRGGGFRGVTRSPFSNPHVTSDPRSGLRGGGGRRRAVLTPAPNTNADADYGADYADDTPKAPVVKGLGEGDYPSFAPPGFGEHGRGRDARAQQQAGQGAFASSDPRGSRFRPPPKDDDDEYDYDDDEPQQPPPQQKQASNDDEGDDYEDYDSSSTNLNPSAGASNNDDSEYDDYDDGGGEESQSQSQAPRARFGGQRLIGRGVARRGRGQDYGNPGGAEKGPNGVYGQDYEFKHNNNVNDDDDDDGDYSESPSVVDFSDGDSEDYVETTVQRSRPPPMPRGFRQRGGRLRPGMRRRGGARGGRRRVLPPRLAAMRARRMQMLRRQQAARSVAQSGVPGGFARQQQVQSALRARLAHQGQQVQLAHQGQQVQLAHPGQQIQLVHPSQSAQHQAAMFVTGGAGAAQGLQYAQSLLQPQPNIMPDQSAVFSMDAPREHVTKTVFANSIHPLGGATGADSASYLQQQYGQQSAQQQQSQGQQQQSQQQQQTQQQQSYTQQLQQLQEQLEAQQLQAQQLEAQQLQAEQLQTQQLQAQQLQSQQLQAQQLQSQQFQSQQPQADQLQAQQLQAQQLQAQMLQAQQLQQLQQPYLPQYGQSQQVYSYQPQYAQQSAYSVQQGAGASAYQQQPGGQQLAYAPVYGAKELGGASNGLHKPQTIVVTHSMPAKPKVITINMPSLPASQHIKIVTPVPRPLPMPRPRRRFPPTGRPFRPRGRQLGQPRHRPLPQRRRMTLLRRRHRPSPKQHSDEEEDYDDGAVITTSYMGGADGNDDEDSDDDHYTVHNSEEEMEDTQDYMGDTIV